MAAFKDVAKAFVPHFYTLFDTQRASLASLFLDNSMLTSEEREYLGQANIMARLGELPQCRHQHQTIDAQPTVNNGVLVLVTGNIYIDTNPIRFSDVFHLQPLPSGQGYYCYNTLMRLNYG